MWHNLKSLLMRASPDPREQVLGHVLFTRARHGLQYRESDMELEDWIERIARTSASLQQRQAVVASFRKRGELDRDKVRADLIRTAALCIAALEAMKINDLGKQPGPAPQPAEDTAGSL